MNLEKILEQIIVAKVNDSGIIVLVVSNDGISANILSPFLCFGMS